ncbi:MAG: hypothetical protein V8R80_01670 [Eubacterium sp.]
MKENDDFRRFNHRSAEKVYKEFMLYAIGRNINKYHRFLCDKLKKFEGKTDQKTQHKEKCDISGNKNKAPLRPKTGRQ